MAFISSPRYRQFQPPVIAPGLIDPDVEDDEFLGAPPVPPPGPNAPPAGMPMRAAATPAPPPQQLTNAQAGVSSMPLAPLNGGGPRQPPPNPYRAQAATPASTVPPAAPPVQQGPPPNPNAAPVPGALDNQVATSDSDANISPQAPPVDARAPIADQLAEKRQELVSHDQGVKSNIMQRIALAALAMTRFSPMAPFLVHPKASLERTNLTNQIADLEGAQANEYKEAQIEAEKQHGNYWENRSLQERNRFKFDPKTGVMYDMATGQITQQPKSLQDHIADYTAAGFSPQDARLLATGQKPTPMTTLPDKLADNLGLPHGFEMPTEHIATLIAAGNRPAPNKTEAQLALDANNADPQIAGPAKAALGLLLKNREAIKLTVQGGRVSGDDSADDTAQTWADNIRNGLANMSQVPMKHKDAVAKLLKGSSAPLSTTAQTALAQTEPTLQQINRLITQLEPLKDNDMAGYFLPDRVGYAMGKSGSLGGLIADLSMAGVQGATRILKGGSRGQMALQRALEHTPNAWLDSPKNAYEKLVRMRENIQDGVNYIRHEGNKYGIEGANGKDGTTPGAVTIRTFNPATGRLE